VALPPLTLTSGGVPATIKRLKSNSLGRVNPPRSPNPPALLILELAVLSFQVGMNGLYQAPVRSIPTWNFAESTKNNKEPKGYETTSKAESTYHAAEVVSWSAAT